MRRAAHIAALNLLALSLSAQVQFHYTCPSGETFDVRFLTPQGGREGALLLTRGKPAITLPRAPSGSGARYSDGYTTLWTKGNDALIESGSVNVKDCKGTRM